MAGKARNVKDSGNIVQATPRGVGPVPPLSGATSKAGQCHVCPGGQSWAFWGGAGPRRVGMPIMA